MSRIAVPPTQIRHGWDRIGRTRSVLAFSAMQVTRSHTGRAGARGRRRSERTGHGPATWEKVERFDRTVEAGGRSIQVVFEGPELQLRDREQGKEIRIPRDGLPHMTSIVEHILKSEAFRRAAFEDEQSDGVMLESKSVVVEGVPNYVTWKRLAAYMRTAGEVTHVEKGVKMSDPRALRTVFVRYRSYYHVRRAVRLLDKTLLGGEEIRVRLMEAPDIALLEETAGASRDTLMDDEEDSGDATAESRYDDDDEYGGRGGRGHRRERRGIQQRSRESGHRGGGDGYGPVHADEYGWEDEFDAAGDHKPRAGGAHRRDGMGGRFDNSGPGRGQRYRDEAGGGRRGVRGDGYPGPERRDSSNAEYGGDVRARGYTHRGVLGGGHGDGGRGVDDHRYGAGGDGVGTGRGDGGKVGWGDEDDDDIGVLPSARRPQHHAPQDRGYTQAEVGGGTDGGHGGGGVTGVKWADEEERGISVSGTTGEGAKNPNESDPPRKKWYEW